MNFNIVAIVIVALFALIGFTKGFLSQIISYVTAVVALVVAYVFRHKVAGGLLEIMEERYPDVGADHKMLIVISMLLIFIVIYFILGGILETIKRRVVITFSMKMSDRFFGFILGTLKGAILVLLCIFVIDYTKESLENKSEINDSFKEKFDKYEEFLDKSEAYNYGRSVLAYAEQNYSWVSNVTSRADITFVEEK